jgi:hypothetical protein
MIEDWIWGDQIHACSNKKSFEHFSVFLSVVEIRTAYIQDPLPLLIFSLFPNILTLLGIQSACHCLIVLPPSSLPWQIWISFKELLWMYFYSYTLGRFAVVYMLVTLTGKHLLTKLPVFDCLHSNMCERN